MPIYKKDCLKIFVQEIISKLTDQGYEIESAVTDGIHGLVESNEIKKGKKVEFGRRKNNNNNNINNVGSDSDSNATTNDKSFEEIDRRISDIEQEVQNIKQRIETIGGEDKSNNNRVVDALQTQINELKNTVKNTVKTPYMTTAGMISYPALPDRFPFAPADRPWDSRMYCHNSVSVIPARDVSPFSQKPDHGNPSCGWRRL